MDHGGGFHVNPIAPIVRWAGGKSSKVSLWERFRPKDYRNRKHVESFVGSGAFVFSWIPRDVIISDINTQLMSMYATVRDSPGELITDLKLHLKEDSKDHYYAVRDHYNDHITDLDHPILMAGYFLYLNARCFNGLYRVNKAGKFNVGLGHAANDPDGIRKPLRLYQIIDTIPTMSRYLKSIEIWYGSYVTINPYLPNAFYLFDPPYHNGFTQYDAAIWDISQFKKLREYVDLIDLAKNKFLLCNADTPFIRECFTGYHYNFLSVPRYISCDGTSRNNAREIVITNYPVPTITQSLDNCFLNQTLKSNPCSNP